MPHRGASLTPWWQPLLGSPVVYLADVEPQLLSVALDPVPDGAPAIVRFRPATAGFRIDQIPSLLDELDAAAVKLFPRWLPGAERLDGPNQLGIAAVRALAAEASSRSANFRPFVADLASRGLRDLAGEPAGVGRSRFPAEVRAAGLVRVIADAYGRDSLVVLVDVPDGLSPAEERGLVAAAEWLANHGGAAVWLAGAALRFTDRVRAVRPRLPAYVEALAVEVARPHAAPGQVETHDPRRAATAPADRAVLLYPPVSGYPRRDSDAEQALEKALGPCDWARGRHWNRTYEWHPLSEVYRLDLFWPGEGVVVEVDGDDHRGKVKYADDRRRDVRLLLNGIAVLRFTNEQVTQDVNLVLSTIRKVLVGRRDKPEPRKEMIHHVGR